MQIVHIVSKTSYISLLFSIFSAFAMSTFSVHTLRKCLQMVVRIVIEFPSALSGKLKNYSETNVFDSTSRILQPINSNLDNFQVLTFLKVKVPKFLRFPIVEKVFMPSKNFFQHWKRLTPSDYRGRFEFPNLTKGLGLFCIWK